MGVEKIMSIDLKDYNKWKEKTVANGGEASMKRYLLHNVFKDVNMMPKNTKISEEILMVSK